MAKLFQSKEQFVHWLIQKNGNPSRDLYEIFQILNCPIHEKKLDEIYTVFQKYGRKKNQERWEMDLREEDKKDLLFPIFKRLGMVQEILPQLKDYKTVIVLGGNVGRMRARVHFLEKLWNLGVRFKEILFLVGDRPLSSSFEEEKNPLNSACSTTAFRPNWIPSKEVFKTEAEVVPLVWDQIVWDEQLRNTTFQVLSTPFVRDTETQEMRRPDTADTIQTWISKEYVCSGAYLAISNNPFIPYQDAAIRSVLKGQNLYNTISLETVGPGVSLNLSVASYLDALFTLFRVEYNMFQEKGLYA